MNLHYWEWVRFVCRGYDSVIDIGCNDGNTWRMGRDGYHDRPADPHSLAGLPPRIVGVDYDDIADLPLEFVCADARDLPFADGSFDVAVLSQILEHVPTADVRQVVAEACRVAQKRVVVTLPVGAYPALSAEGDAMARSNPWLTYARFVPDSVYPHHGHVREFPHAEAAWEFLMDLTPLATWRFEQSIQSPSADGTVWFGAVFDKRKDEKR